MGPQDLLIFPCSAAKEGLPLARPIPQACIKDFIGNREARELESTRKRVFKDKRYEIWIRNCSPLIPGLVLYSGNQYEVPHFKDRVLDAIRSGVHCLILSGGYGLIRAEEPIHLYGATITSTMKYWRDVIPEVLANYIRRNEIRRVFIGCSTSYSAVLKRKDWSGNAMVYWCIPKAQPGDDVPLRVVPRLTGEAIVELVTSEFQPSTRWTKRWPE